MFLFLHNLISSLINKIKSFPINIGIILYDININNINNIINRNNGEIYVIYKVNISGVFNILSS